MFYDPGVSSIPSLNGLDDVAFWFTDTIGLPYLRDFGAQSLGFHLTAYNLLVYA